MDDEVVPRRGTAQEVLRRGRSALARWLLVAGVEVVCHRVDGENADRLHDRGLYMLGLAAGRACDQCGEDPGRRRYAGDEVRERRARELRCIGVAEDGQQPPVRLAYVFVTGSEGHRTAASESADRREHQVRAQSGAVLPTQ